MAQSRPTKKKRLFGSTVFSMATLAVWRLRHMRGMLFVTGLGIVAAVMLVCTVPLYSQIALTAGLRGVLTANRDSATITVTPQLALVSNKSIDGVSLSIKQYMFDVGVQKYLDEPSQLVIQSTPLPIEQPHVANSSDTLALNGYGMQAAAKHVRLVRGRLPHTQGTQLEVALTPETATAFHVDVGSVLVVSFSIITVQPDGSRQGKTYHLPLHVVGIYTANVVDDVFWHGNDVHLAETGSLPPTLHATALVILFFVGMMTELLVERQAETIAILGSRGANRLQIFGSFMTQSIGLGIVALCVGPPLAIVAVNLVAQRVLPVQQQDALGIISRDLVGTMYSVRNYALATVLLAIATMGFAMYRAIGMDVLAIRREAARATTRPLWHRLNLDIVAIIVAITGYFVSQYTTGIQQLSPRASALIVSPLTLIAPLFLVIAGILLVLRFFPLLLRFGSSFATRGRGASAMLALGQMSRTPRQSLRMTLLLALASGFAIFSLIFLASQEQRAYDLAAFQVGADFSGPISYDSSQPIGMQTADFVKQTHGVVSATIGYAGRVATGENALFDVRGVDADTFAHTAIWTQADSTQSLNALMQLLIAQRGVAAKNQAIPALVDSEMWRLLHLSVGKRFVLHNDNNNDGVGDGTFMYVAVAEIEHIPTMSNNGLLFDYQSGDMLYHRVPNGYLPRNYLWIKSSDDSGTIDQLRTRLTSTQPLMSPLGDRRAYMQKLSADPLYLDLIGVLTIGAITALLLALVGNFLASWLSTRNRVTNFVVLRALGTSQQQVAGVLTWEQGITYITAIVLGIVFGALLSATAIPSLVFSSVPNTGLTSQSSSNQFYALQHIIPVQITVPASLLIALLLLIIICAIALWMMVRVVTQPALGQMLRLNED